MAELSAWIMFMRAMASGPLFRELLALALQMLGHLVIHVIEHRERDRDAGLR